MPLSKANAQRLGFAARTMKRIFDLGWYAWINYCYYNSSVGLEEPQKATEKVVNMLCDPVLGTDPCNKPTPGHQRNLSCDMACQMITSEPSELDTFFSALSERALLEFVLNLQWDLKNWKSEVTMGLFLGTSALSLACQCINVEMRFRDGTVNNPKTGSGTTRKSGCMDLSKSILGKADRVLWGNDNAHPSWVSRVVGLLSFGMYLAAFIPKDIREEITSALDQVTTGYLPTAAHKLLSYGVPLGAKIIGNSMWAYSSVAAAKEIADFLGDVFGKCLARLSKEVVVIATLQEAQSLSDQHLGSVNSDDEVIGSRLLLRSDASSSSSGWCGGIFSTTKTKSAASRASTFSSDEPFQRASFSSSSSSAASSSIPVPSSSSSSSSSLTNTSASFGRSPARPSALASSVLSSSPLVSHQPSAHGMN